MKILLSSVYSKTQNLSRLAGASMAEGDILLFMDSHCECYPNWLVPLIQHVACDRTSIAVPGENQIQEFFYISA